MKEASTTEFKAKATVINSFEVNSIQFSLNKIKLVIAEKIQAVCIPIHVQNCYLKFLSASYLVLVRPGKTKFWSHLFDHRRNYYLNWHFNCQKSYSI